jgi:GAF domain-containing protein
MSMSNLQPSNNQGLSFVQRAVQIWAGMIKPHSSIKTISEHRRAQLLSILTLIISLSFFSVTFFNPRSFSVFLILGGITITSYALSRTKYYRVGIYIFTYAFTAIGFLRIYQGNAVSIESAIVSTVHIALILSSALLSKRGFVALAILSTIAAFTAPLYSNISAVEDGSIGRTAGIVFAISAILYGIQIFRENLEKEGLKEITDSNRKLEDMTINLEQRIEARTLELEKANQQVQERATRLQVISDISREITFNVEQQPGQLLNVIAQLISEKLGFYHVGIFLLDENREFAVLRAANSEGGQRMLERRHQLKVGGTGIVGYVSQGGLPRIALDAGSDAVFFNNPDLPKTRSEIALPLKYGSKNIGVLDVQSTMPFAFNDEDANLLGTLTNQIAIVINAILINERAGFGYSAQGMRQPEQMTRNRQTQKGYSYLPDGTISSALLTSNPAIDRARTTGETVMQVQPSKNNPSTLVVPVKFHDQVIGIIHIEAAEPNRRWTDDEITVVQSISDRAAFALENARLLEETSRRADQEETIATITTRIGSSNDFNRIMQTTIQELGRALGASRSFIHLGTSSENGRGYKAGHNKSVNSVS